MRHRLGGRKLAMDSSERKAMFRNMVTSILVHGQSKTTEARAKEIRRFVEKVITMGKNADKVDGLEGEALRVAKANRVHAIRNARLWVHDDEALKKVFGEFATRYATRPGGYTRIIKVGKRKGDNADMAIIQLVDNPVAAPAVEADAPAPEVQPEG
jgi:large subunit ribosomal protein L17